MGTSGILNQDFENQISDQSLELKEARNGSLIPVIDGVHLHSAYNPQREAKAFIEKHAETLDKNSRILLLGLGFAYHLNQMAEYLEKVHGKDFEIVVIEPNGLLLEEAKRHKLLPVSRNIFYYTSPDAEKLYKQKDLVNFLVEHPGIIMHAPCFNLNRKFFEGFLARKSPNTIQEAHELPLNEDILNFLNGHSKELHFNDLVEKTRTAPKISGLSHLLLGVSNIKQSTSTPHMEKET